MKTEPRTSKIHVGADVLLLPPPLAPLAPIACRLPPALAETASRAREREATISRIALFVGDRAEAQRAVELAERCGASADAAYTIAATGRQLPGSEAEMREALLRAQYEGRI